MSASLDDIPLPWLTKDIEKFLPHRHPFLLIDRVIELVENEKIVAVKNISVSDPILQGHFPGQPIYPGVLILESMAQAAGVLGRTILRTSSTCFLTEITEARFRRLVVPGDTLKLEIIKEKERKTFFWFQAHAYVDGELTATAKISALLR